MDKRRPKGARERDMREQAAFFFVMHARKVRGTAELKSVSSSDFCGIKVPSSVLMQ